MGRIVGAVLLVLLFAPSVLAAESRRLIGAFKITYYWVAQERTDDGPGDQEIFDLKGRSLGSFSKRFVRALKMEGSAVTLDGRMLNVAGRVGGVTRFQVVEAPFGLGCRNNPLVPFRSVATDQKTVPYGTVLFIPQAVGAKLPSGGRHDGFFIAADVGGGIQGLHLDVFTGLGDQRRVLTGQGLLNLRSYQVYEIVGAQPRPELVKPLIGPGVSPNPDREDSGLRSSQPRARRGRVTARSLNLREGPSTETLILRRLARGSELIIHERRGSWLRVDADQDTGWVHGDFVDWSTGPADSGAKPRSGGAKSEPDGGGDSQPTQPLPAGPDDSTAGVGPRGRRIPKSLRGRLALAAPRLSNRRRYLHYRKLAAAHGYRIAEKTGERTVIGLRGLASDGRIFPEQTRPIRAYIDTFIVLWRDERGGAHVETFLGSTSPGQAKTRYVGTPDVDADGLKDIAHIRPGRYRYKPGTFKGLSAFRPLDKTPAYRDTNQDGHIDGLEQKASLLRRDVATGILFHRGLDGRPSSVGCQTLAPGLFDAFETALSGDEIWEYILIDPR